MGLKSRARQILTALLRNYNYEVLPNSLLYDWQLNRSAQFGKETVLPAGAEDYLQANNPRLLELQGLYENFDQDVTTPLLWKDDYIKPADLQLFRGLSAYVAQQKNRQLRHNLNVMGYALATYYVKSADSLRLLEKLEEDDYFGVSTHLVADKVISRDLLDSINEIYFLEKHLHISSLSNLSILDIGAGYGRLAHRMVDALPNIQSYFCTDAFAVSTFICEYYLHFRDVEKKAKVISLDQIEKTLMNQPVSIAINIHSFSECSLSAIRWWMSLLRICSVDYLMIVPNAIMDNAGMHLLTQDGYDFQKIIEEYDYKLIIKEPKYLDPVVQQYAINPTHYYLFKRN